MRITVLGAGNGAVSAAAHMTLLGHQVTLSNRSPEKLKPYMEENCIRIEGAALPNVALQLHKIEADIKESIRDAEVIMICVPTIGHEYYAQQIAPVLKQEQTVFLNPGHMGGALQFAKYLRKNGYKEKLNIFESNTLTYIARMTGKNTVGIYSIAKQVMIASLPSKNDNLQKILAMYPDSQYMPNVLQIALSDLNAVMHPPAMLLNAALIERTQEGFTIYDEGTTAAVATLIEALDNERLSVANAAGVHLPSFLEMFYKWGYTTEDAFNKNSVYEALKQSAPNKTINNPPSLTHRYISEDVGNGLVPMSLIGDLAGVDTPIMDSFIALCSKINGVNYLEEGLTLEKLGLGSAKSVEDLYCIIGDLC